MLYIGNTCYQIVLLRSFQVQYTSYTLDYFITVNTLKKKKLIMRITYLLLLFHKSILY